jgi:hypothetical protein
LSFWEPVRDDAPESALTRDFSARSARRCRALPPRPNRAAARGSRPRVPGPGLLPSKTFLPRAQRVAFLLEGHLAAVLSLSLFVDVSASLAMDFLHFDTTFSVMICTRCQYALVPGTLAAHLGTLHKEEVMRDKRKRCVELRPRRRSSGADSSEFNPFPHSDVTKPRRFRGRYHKQ